MEAQSCDSLGVSQELLARYLFELRNNRLTDCEPGGDFLVDPAAINYSVTSLICQVNLMETELFMTGGSTKQRRQQHGS